MKRRSMSTKLRRGIVTAVLVATALVVFAAPAFAWVHLDGYGCRISGSTITAWIDVSSGASGTAYVNIYRRSSPSNVLVEHRTQYGSDIFLHAYEPYVSGRSYFATMGFNGPQGNASWGLDCRRY
jgi:hypothetical protein